MSIPQTQSAVTYNNNLDPVVTTIPVQEPSDSQILIKSKTFAVSTSSINVTEDNIGAVLGFDVFGIIIKVGKDVKGFEVGDQVSALIFGGYRPPPLMGAFAEYVICEPRVTVKYSYVLQESRAAWIPVGPPLTFEGAATFTVSLLTAGTALYYGLNLQKGEDYSDQSIIIWGAGTSIGTIAVQLCKWLGFKNIIASSSKQKHESLKQLGATSAFDYREDNVVEEIRELFGDDITYGLDAHGAKESVASMYYSMSNTKPIYVTDLQVSGLSHVNLKSNPVHYNISSVSLALGPFELYGNRIEVPEGYDEKFDSFKRDVQPLIDNKEITIIPIKVKEGGLNGVLDALKVSKTRLTNDKLAIKA